ncbi:MAG: hypothetical protein ACREJD_13520 [Phycisphaerales bacterium]
MNRLLGGVAAALVLASSSQAANLVVNGGFEDPITYDGAPFVGSWEGFSGAGAASAANSPLNPRSGLQCLKASITNTQNTFAGAFQDVVGLTSGNMTSLRAWMMTTSTVMDLVVEMRIEWRNSISNTEISRTANVNPILNGVYQEVGIDALVPVGADSARLVFAVQTFTAQPTHTGFANIDDVSFVEVPAPGAIATGLAGLGLLGARRRRTV